MCGSASSVDLGEDLALKRLLKDVELAVVDLLGLTVASGQKQVTVEVPASEHRGQCL